MSLIFELTKDIERFVIQLPETIDAFHTIINDYNNLLSENESLKKENDSLKKKVKKFNKIPCVPCTIIKKN